MIEQFKHFYIQYLENRKQLIEAIKQQYAPKLMQKQQELAAQYGHEVTIVGAVHRKSSDSLVAALQIGKIFLQINGQNTYTSLPVSLKQVLYNPSVPHPLQL
jgi:hypothetical protein